MKNFKSYIKALAALVVTAVGLSACQDNVDAPADNVPKATLTPNTSLLELKTEFWDEATNYAKVIKDDNDPERRFIISGRVLSSDEEGNVFKSLIIQDETAALAFSIDSYNLYLRYRRGQEVVLDVTGMDIGKYAGLEQIGRKSYYENGKTDQVSFMAPETFRNIVELNGMPELAELDTLTVNTFGELSQTPEGLRKWQSQLVRFRNVYFEEGGKRKLSVWHSSANEDQNTTIVDRNGQTMTVRTSGYCTFFNQTLPVGNIDVVGILGYYNTSWQIILIDGDGLVKVGEQPGSKEKPYTVEQAIADEQNGIKSNGWVKGYIVGTLAPEVEDKVAANSDIQWEAPFVISTSIVIADAADVRDFSKCIVVPLTPDSPFQQHGNLADNEANLGKEILVKGDLEKYLDTWGLTGNSGKADEFEIEGLTIDTGAIADGDGSEEKPFNVTQVVAKNPQSTTAAVDGGTGVWVEGYIVGSMPTGGSSTTLSGTNFSTVDAATTNLVLGPTPDCTDYSKCVGVQLPSSMRSELALANKPGNLGKRLAVKGDIMKYCGGPGVKNLTANKLGEGGTPDVPTPPVTGDFPDGNGQQTTPYNVSQIVAMNPTSTTEAVQSAVWVKGYIVGSMPTGGSSTLLSNAVFGTADAATTNLVLGPTANCTDPSQCVGVQLPISMRDALALANKPENLGKVLSVKGDIMKYCGGPGVKNLTENVLEGGSVTPPTPSETTVFESLGENNANLPAGWTFDNVNIGSLSDVWSWKTYNDKGYLNGSAYVAGSAVAAEAYAVSPVIDLTGATAPVFSFDHAAKFQTTLRSLCGVVVREEGATAWTALTVPTWPEAGSWAFVNSGNISLAAYAGKKVQIAFKYGSSTSGADTWEIKNLKVLASGTAVTPTPDPTPDPDPNPGPTPSGDAVNVAVDNFKGPAGGDGKPTMLGSATVDGYTITIDKAAGATAPAYNEYNGAGTIRVYADNTLTVAGAKMAKIVFTLNTSTGAKRYTTFTPNTGSVGSQTASDTEITWSGDATSVTFTVGHDATIGSDGPTKRGQIHITDIKIYPAK